MPTYATPWLFTAIYVDKMWIDVTKMSQNWPELVKYEQLIC